MAEKKICPNCLSDMVAESIGWKCENCLAFLDMQGVLHEHKEKPFMPPMTNADRIRAMSDEELAELFHGFCDNGERCVYCPLYEKSCAGVHSDVPKWLEWLQQPAEGEYL